MIAIIMSNNIHDKNVFFSLRYKDNAINKFLPLIMVPNPAIGANMSKEDVTELRDYLTSIIEEDNNVSNSRR